MGHDWQVLNPLDVIRRYTEDVWNGADPDAMAAFVADPCLRHEAGHLDTMDLATNRARLVETLARFPELAIVNRELLADGERVASCYELSWFEDGQRRAICGIEVFRVQNGKISETWNATPAEGVWG